MVNFARRTASGRQLAPNDAVPEEIARALDASAEDLKRGRIVSLDDTLKEAKAKLMAYRARKKKSSR